MRLPSLGSVLDASPAVLFAYLFGSASHGRLSPLSDVDIAVYLDIDPALVLNALQHHLQDLTGFLQAILRLAQYSIGR